MRPRPASAIDPHRRMRLMVHAKTTYRWPLSAPRTGRLRTITHNRRVGRPDVCSLPKAGARGLHRGLQGSSPRRWGGVRGRAVCPDRATGAEQADPHRGVVAWPGLIGGIQPMRHAAVLLLAVSSSTGFPAVWPSAVTR